MLYFPTQERNVGKSVEFEWKNIGAFDNTEKISMFKLV